MNTLERTALLANELATIGRMFPRRNPDPTVLDNYLTSLIRRCSHCTAEQIREVFLAVAERNTYFPKLSEILRHVPDAPRTPSPFDELPVSSNQICNQCHTHRYYSGFKAPSGAILPKVRCGCPLVGDGWHDPEALDWQEDDQVLIQAGWVPPAMDR